MSTAASRLVAHDTVATLILSGDIGHEDAGALRDHLDAALSPPVERLAIDLSSCGFLNPVAVDLVGAAIGKAHEHGMPASLEGASANVRVILGIAGLLDLPSDGGSP
ncbi:MAG: STAS domain-containing protein [Actinobacteria bacterium]|nr:STAS domain-containing protein [Actinomycetota bacterium]MCB8997075.1 STAS domain-containing protein [Actinomycetota bacterium]MCB9425184.1 STAS domain-containing protein [Actinomycetota bacterium]HRY09163.1 STAS domain-containing protein [Candidatus Nanopelagicales bacterium]